MLAERYRAVRSFTTALAAPLSEEDAVVQSMPDASPAKWHLAHTTWFFETFVLARTIPSYEPVHPAYAFLFNSYYEAVGDRHPRPERGLITRPSLAEVLRYRARVDEQVLDWLGSRGELKAEIAFSLTLGLHHEQQHQELLLTDIHHAFSRNPMRPAYRSRAPRSFEEKHPESLAWIERPEGLFSIGHQASPGRFAFDNESPRHRTFVERYALGSRLVTNAEYLEFILDGGYRRAELWLSDGWATAHARGWEGPLYWERPAQPGRPPSHVFTLRGLVPLDPRAPVSNVSFYEADAFARWATARLPTEAEWEIAAEHVEIDGNFVERDRLEPAPVSGTPNADVPAQLFGDLWEWTASPYVAYPGFVPFAGDLGEYNGKFMCNQTVLRGGSCLTSRSHIRASYRNFFPPDARWQYTGIRLARPR